MTIAELRMGAISAGWGDRAPSPQDAWIAATALALDAPLATNNRRDFEHIQKLRLISL
jgi:predicted nucleic acid-binding protein